MDGYLPRRKAAITLPRRRGIALEAAYPYFSESDANFSSVTYKVGTSRPASRKCPLSDEQLELEVLIRKKRQHKRRAGDNTLCIGNIIWTRLSSLL